MLSVKSLKENILPKLTLKVNGWYANPREWVENTPVSSYEFFEYKGQKITAYKESGTNSFYIHFLDENKEGITKNSYTLYDDTTVEVDASTIPKETMYMVFTFWNNHVNPKLFIEGQSYPASSIVKKKTSVNGEDTLSLRFLFDEINADFVSDLDFNWKAVFQDDEYTLVNPSAEAIIKQKSITAMLSFFTDLNSVYLQDEVEDKSMTALNAYTELFSHTNKRVHLVDSFYANTLNYSKNQTLNERFHYYNERFKVEFEVRGDDVYLYNKIGLYKPDVRIDEELNVKDATIEKDTESFFTWCKCYFDKDENEEIYNQQKVYKNDEMYDIYGDIEGPAIYQGNIRGETAMLEYAAHVHANSYSVSHSVSLVDLQRQGYDEFIFNKGDVIRLSLKSLSQTIDIRIIEKDETWVENQYGEWERIDLTLTLGNERIVNAYKRSRTDSLIELEDWLSGRKPIPFSILPSAAQRAADIILGDTDSVMEYRKDKLTGHHSKNEGNNITINASGIVLYRDGVPKTAITYEGMTADVINTGQLNTQNVKVIGTQGLLLIDGDSFIMKDFDGKSSTVIEPGKITLSKNVTITRYDEVPYILNGTPQFEVPIITEMNMDIGVEFNRRNYETISEEFVQFEIGYTAHAGRWAIFDFQVGLDPSAANFSRNIEVLVEPSTTPEGSSIEPVTIRKLIYRDEPTQQMTISLPLPPPTYGALSFLLKYRVLNNHAENIGTIRSTRKRIGG